MSRPPTIEGHPLRRWNVWTTKRAQAVFEAEAKRRGVKLGVYLDQIAAKKGGWNHD